jgi:Kef-type K+ transport system membrane component KefB
LLLLLGIAIFGGFVGAKIFKKLKIPQIVGYVVIGVVLGPILDLFDCAVISQDTIEMLEPFNVFALGIIGFLVGGELKKDIFVRFGKQVPIILILEGVTAFLFVGIFTFIVMMFSFGWEKSLAVAVVFASICSATDPASTISVLWEYKARGPLSSMLAAIVTLDDALALFLYAIGVSVAGIIIGHEELGLLKAVLNTSYVLLGAAVLGLVGGFIINWMLKRIEEGILIFSFSAVLLFIGLAIQFKTDVILSAMVLGVTIVNFKSKKIDAVFSGLHNFSTPIYVLFFVLVGARLQFRGAGRLVWFLVVAYIIGSVSGKTIGAYLGGRFSDAVKTVKNYLGFCLYPQGGIAVGLLIMASGRFDADTSSMMLLVVVIGAFFLQMVGPIGVKIGAKKAGEIGLNITENDLVKTYKVADVMDTNMPVIRSDQPLREVLKIVSTTASYYYPMLDSNNRLIGAVTLDGIRNVFATHELNDWLVALDIIEPVGVTVTEDMKLSDAIDKAKKFGVDYMSVVDKQQKDKYIGLVSINAVRRQLAAEVISKQQRADSMYQVNVT